MISDAYKAIVKHLNSYWAKTPIAWENSRLAEPTVPWMRPTFIPLDNVRATLGTDGKDRFDCYLVIDIFTELNTGIGEAAELVDHAFELFPGGTEITTDDGYVIKFLSPIPLQGFDEGNGYYQSTIRCPWYVYR